LQVVIGTKGEQMSQWDLSYEVYCEWCAAKGDAPPTREWYERWMTGMTAEERVMLDLKRARIEHEREERGEQ
jgi:hypothetical protein